MVAGNRAPRGERDSRYGWRGDPPPDKTARIILVRHGESRCAVAGVVGGPKGCKGLTELGVSQVHQLGRRLARTAELGKVATLYSSVLPRAVETADILSAYLGSPPRQEDCDLCELHPGECDAMTWADYQAAYGVDFSTDPEIPLSPGGESWRGFLERVGHALATLAERHRGDTAVVAGHGGIVDGSMAVFLGAGEHGTRLDLRTHYASLTEWQVADGYWRLARYNDSAHLHDADPSARRGERGHQSPIGPAREGPRGRQDPPRVNRRSRGPRA